MHLVTWQPASFAYQIRLPTKYDFRWWTPVSDIEIFCLELFSLQMFTLHFCLSVSSLDVISDLICTWSLQRRDKLYIMSSSICVLNDVIKLLVERSPVPLVDSHGINISAKYTSLPLLHWHTPMEMFCNVFCFLSRDLWIALMSAVKLIDVAFVFSFTFLRLWLCFWAI